MEIKNNKVGIFGPIYDQFQKQPKLAIKHFIPIVVQFGNLSVKKSDDKKLILESETFRIVIQTRWDNQVKIFLLTAFDLRKKPE